MFSPKSLVLCLLYTLHQSLSFILAAKYRPLHIKRKSDSRLLISNSTSRSPLQPFVCPDHSSAHLNTRLYFPYLVQHRLLPTLAGPLTQLYTCTPLHSHPNPHPGSGPSRRQVQSLYSVPVRIYTCPFPLVTVECDREARSLGLFRCSD